MKLNTILRQILKSKQLIASFAMLFSAFHFLSAGLVDFAIKNGIRLSPLIFGFIQNDTRGQLFLLSIFGFFFSELYTSLHFGKNEGMKTALIKIELCFASAFLYVLLSFLIAQICILSVADFKLESSKGWGIFFGRIPEDFSGIFLPNVNIIKEYSSRYLFWHSLIFEFLLLFSLSLLFVLISDIFNKIAAVLLMMATIFSDILFYNLFTVPFRKLSIVTLSMLSSFEEAEKACGLTQELSYRVFFILIVFMVVVHFLYAVLFNKSQNHQG